MIRQIVGLLLKQDLFSVNRKKNSNNKININITFINAMLGIVQIRGIYKRNLPILKADDYKKYNGWGY